MSKPALPWLSDDLWSRMSGRERSLVSASVDADVLRVRESGHNRGARVEEYLSAVNLKGGLPYCAAFVTFHLLLCGFRREKLPQNPASTCSWAHGTPGASVMAKPDGTCRGDLFVWCDRARWQGHIGFIVRAYKKFGVWWIDTIEGNTDDGGSREGDGVYRRTRRWTTRMRVIRLPQEHWS